MSAKVICCNFCKKEDEVGKLESGPIFLQGIDDVHICEDCVNLSVSVLKAKREKFPRSGEQE